MPKQTPKGDKPVSDALIAGVLTEAEIEAIKAKARANVDKEKRQAATDAILEHETEMLRRAEGLVEDDPTEEIVEIRVDLGPMQDRITLDGKHYMHGGVYKVRRAVAGVIAEQNWRSWRHEAERKGETGTLAGDIYKPKNTTLSPLKGVTGMPRTAA